MTPHTVLVGRSSEQDSLFSMLALALQGTGSTVLVSGDAGAGKTALARALAERAAGQACVVAYGQAYDRTEAAPYSIWFELLSAIGRDQSVAHETRDRLVSILAPDANHGGQHSLVDRIVAVLQALAAERPLLLVLEDLQWADRASIELLRLFVRSVSSFPIMVLATYRQEDLTQHSPLYEYLPNLVREAGAERIELRPLGRAEIVEFLCAQYAIVFADPEPLVDYLQDHTEGNPLFLGEMIRVLIETGTIYPEGEYWRLGAVVVPPLVKQLVATRLNDLSADTLLALRTAAVVGQVVPYDLWIASLAIDEQRLAQVIREAIDANVLRQSDDGDQLEFAHAIVRDVIYEDLVIPERRKLHRVVADALIASFEPDPDAVASHLQRARDERAFEWLMRAGNRAQRAYALRMAADRFKSALRTRGTPAEPTREYGWLLYRTGRLMRFSDPVGAVSFMTQAERAGRSAGDPVLAAYAIADRGLMRSFEGELKAGLIDIEIGTSRLERLAEARTMLPPAVSLWIQDMVDAGAATSEAQGEPQLIERVPTGMRWGASVAWQSTAGQFERARELGERLLQQERSVPAGVHIGLARSYAATGDVKAARAASEAAIAGVANQDNFVLVGHFVAEQLEIVELPYAADDIPARRQLQELGESAWSRSTEALPGQVPPRAAWSSVLLLEGEWRDALQLARYEAERGFAMRRLQALTTQASIATWQGDFARATEIIRQILPLGPDTEPGDGAFYPTVDAQKLALEIALRRGDHASARDWLDHHRRWIEASGASALEPDVLLNEGLFESELGNPAKALAIFERVISLAAEPRRPLVLIAAQRHAGRARLVQGDIAAAQAILSDALLLAESCLARYETGLTLAALADCEVARGNTATAADQVDSARAIFEQLGAQPALDALLAAADSRGLPDRRTSLVSSELDELPNPANLTSREIEVLQLVASGMSNREIASALGLSIRTIERHVSNIYDKIGVHNRVDATAFAIRQHLA